MNRDLIDPRRLRSSSILDHAIVLSWLDELIARLRPDEERSRRLMLTLVDDLESVAYDPLAFVALVATELATPASGLVPSIPGLGRAEAMVIGLCDGHGLGPDRLARLLRLEPKLVHAAHLAARAALRLPAPGRGCGLEHPDGVESCVPCLLEASTRAVAHAHLVDRGAVPEGSIVEALLAWAEASTAGDVLARPVLHVVADPTPRVFREPEIDAADLLPWAALRELALDTAAIGTVTLHLQPIVELDTLTTIGAEALIRWLHPTEGMIPPDRWLPIAERHNAMGRIGAWVVTTAAELLVGPLEHLPSLSINLSPAELEDPRLPDLVESAFAARGAPTSRLRIEMTETSISTRLDAAQARVVALQELGVGIDLDDFGVGYSTFEHLQALQVDGIKLDRRYAPSATSGDRASEIAAAVLGLAARLGVNATAEGIETEAELEALRALGCTRGQGHLLGHPLPIAEFHARLLSGTTAPPLPADSRPAIGRPR